MRHGLNIAGSLESLYDPGFLDTQMISWVGNEKRLWSAVGRNEDEDAKNICLLQVVEIYKRGIIRCGKTPLHIGALLVEDVHPSDGHGVIRRKYGYMARPQQEAVACSQLSAVREGPFLLAQHEALSAAESRTRMITILNSFEFEPVTAVI
jgi:hypothetical protein